MTSKKSWLTSLLSLVFVFFLICICAAFIGNTPKPTPDLAATSTAAQQSWIGSLTRAAELWTDTPTPTPAITPYVKKAFSTLEFGHYEQDNDLSNGNESIHWLILDETEDSLFIISENVLSRSRMLEKYFPVTWEMSKPREWLNGQFIMEAFSDAERQQIILTNVHTPDNTQSGASGGNDTEDQIFLLSVEEVEEYFPQFEDMQAEPSARAEGECVWKDSEHGGCNWWLRSPGMDQRWVAYVDSYRGIEYHGRDDYFWYNGLRQAMWIKK